MHEKDNENLKFGYLVKYSCNDLASAFGSLLHFFTLLVIPWFQWDEILAVLMMPGLVTHVFALLMIM